MAKGFALTFLRRRSMPDAGNDLVAPGGKAADMPRGVAVFTESMPLSSWMGATVHQTRVQACAMGLGDGLVAELVTAAARVNGVKITP